MRPATQGDVYRSGHMAQSSPSGLFRAAFAVFVFLASSSLARAAIFPAVKLGQISVQAHDVALATVLCTWTFRVARTLRIPSLWGPVGRFIIAITAIGTLAFLRSLVAYPYEFPFKTYVYLLYLPLSFVLARSIASTRHGRDWLISLLTVIAGLSAMINVTQVLVVYLFGSQAIFLMPESVGVLKSIPYVRPPSQALLHITFSTLLVLMVTRRERMVSEYLSRVLALGVITLGILVEFSRHSYVSVLVVILVTVLRYPVRSVPKVAGMGLTLGLLVALLVALLGSVVSDPLTLQLGRSFDLGKVLSDTGTQWRFYELREAWKAFLGSPLIGIGLGAPYRTVHAPGSDTPVVGPWTLVGYIHNGIAWWAVDTGLVGLGALLLGILRLVSVVKQGVTGARQYGFALAVALLGYVAGTLVAPGWLASPSDAPVLGVGLAVIEAERIADRRGGGSREEAPKRWGSQTCGSHLQ